LIFVDETGLESAAAVLSLLIFVVNSDYSLGPVNFKVMDESFHVIVTSKRPTSPQKL
jgi:hypothetical protein